MLLGAAAVSAQGPISATYDVGRRLRLEGPVVRIDWVTPRGFIFVDVRDAGGTTTNWAVEFGDALDLERWNKSAIHLGDVVTVQGVPARGQTRQALAMSVVVKPAGKPSFTVPGPRIVTRSAVSSAAPPPRWPNGHVRLGPPPGKTGYWGAASAKGLVETSGAKISLSNDGLLLDLADADRVAPFKPWAKAVYEYRQRGLLKSDPASQCIPTGGPRQFHTGHGFQLIEQPELGRILVLMGGGNRNWRIIYTDGRPLGQTADVVTTYYGTSVGRWDTDTLIVESVGYNEKFWFTSGGLPHTEALHLSERFSRPDLNTLKYEVTVDDPRTYTRPWTGGWTVRWVPDQDIEEYFCEETAASRTVR